LRFLLDTNICIYAIKRRPPIVLERLRSHEPTEPCLSVITLLELRHGAEKSQFRQKTHAKLDYFLAPFDILPIDEKDALESSRIRARLQMSGTPIGDYDCLIAGQAKARWLTLVSNNVREFGRVQGLRTGKWSIP